MTDPTQFLDALQDSDKDAWEQFYTSHLLPLRFMLARRFSDLSPEEVDDVWAAVIERVYQRIALVQTPQALGGWLWTGAYRTGLTMAHRKRHLQTLTHLEKPRPPRRDAGTIRAVSDADISAIEEIASHPRDLALVRLLRQSGTRASELVKLTWGNLDLDNRKATVTGRYEKTRRVFFRPSAADALTVYRKTVPHDADDPVFWTINGN